MSAFPNYYLDADITRHLDGNNYCFLVFVMYDYSHFVKIVFKNLP